MFKSVKMLKTLLKVLITALKKPYIPLFLTRKSYQHQYFVNFLTYTGSCANLPSIQNGDIFK